MQHYRLYSLDRQGRIASAHDLNCRDDLAALAEGEKECVSHSVEIWQGSRLVARVKQGNEPLNAQDKRSL